MVAPLLTRTMLVMIDSEATYAADATPAVADALEVYDFNWRNDSETRQRLILQSTMSKLAHAVGAQLLSCTFKVELKHYTAILNNDGSGATDPATVDKLTRLMRCCGFAPAWTAEQSTNEDGYVIYSPESQWPDTTNTLAGSATVTFNIDGVLFKMTGVWGNATINIEAGEIPFIDIEMFGLYQAAADSAIAAGTFDDVQPITASGATFSVGGYTTGDFPSMSIGFNNVIARRRSFTAGNGGIRGFFIADRDINGSLLTEQILEATDPPDWLVAGQAGTTQAWTYTHTINTGNGVIITIPKAQFIVGGGEDAEGIAMYRIPFSCRKNSTGDDEITIRVGDIVR